MDLNDSQDPFQIVEKRVAAKLRAELSQLKDVHESALRAQRQIFLNETVTDKQQLRDLLTLHPASDYHEDYGAVLWWHLPVCEPPYVGAGAGMGETEADGKPTWCRALQEKGWLTHWSKIPNAWAGDGQPLFPIEVLHPERAVLDFDEELVRKLTTGPSVCFLGFGQVPGSNRPHNCYDITQQARMAAAMNLTKFGLIEIRGFRVHIPIEGLCPDHMVTIPRVDL